MMRKQFLYLFAFLILNEIAFLFIQPKSGEIADFVWRGIHLLQMVLLILFMTFLKKEIIEKPEAKIIYKLILFGLLFSFIGDVINSYLIDLRFIIKTQSILSAIPFSIAHILYIRGNYLISQKYALQTEENVHSIRKLSFKTLILWPFISIMLWYILVGDSAPILIKYLSFAYAFMVCLMALSSVWVLQSMKKNGIVVLLGGFIFLCSDSIFGYFLMEGPNKPFWASQAIWLTYFMAQLFITQTPFVFQKHLADEANKQQP